MRSRGTALVLATVTLALAAPAGAQHLNAAPPPPRTFGPDQEARGAFTGQGVTKPGLTCDAPAPPTALTCTGYLPSGADGTLLETTVRLPRTRGEHPLVVTMHGWGGSQGSMAKYDDRLTGAGYAVLRYSARGFGGSWGQANLADTQLEGVDLRSAIAQVVDLYPSAVDARAVAVFGASYGGAHAWLAALAPEFTTRGGRPVVVRTVIPVATWSDLLNGLVPNGRPESAQDPAGAQKLSFVEGLFAGGIRTRADRPYPNYPEYLVLWDAQMLANEAPYSATPTGRMLVDGLQGYRSVYWQTALWERVRQRHATGAPQLPVLAIQGWTDDLFPPVEALRMYDALRSIDPAYPIALYLGDVGHPRAANKAGELDYLLDGVMRWLGFYLQGKGPRPAFDVRAAITRPRTAPFAASDVVEVRKYADLATSTAIHRFGGWRAITFDPVNLSGLKWDPLVLLGCEELQPCPSPPASDPVPGDVASYELKAADVAHGKPFLVAGEPAVMLYAATVANRLQLDVRLLDVAPGGTRSLITRGTVTLDSGSGAPLGMRRVRIAAWGNLWEVPADHTLRLEVTNVDSPYLRPSLVPSATAISDVSLSLPIRDAPPGPVVASGPAPAPAAAPAAAAPSATPAATAAPSPAAIPPAIPSAVSNAASTAAGAAAAVPTAVSNAASAVTSTLPSTAAAVPAAASNAISAAGSAGSSAAAALPAPTAAPLPIATPTAAPLPTAAPTAAPIPTAAPTAAPLPPATPTAAPIPTAAPTAAPLPTATPAAAPLPAAAPTAAPLPNAPPTAAPVPTSTAAPAAPQPAPTAPLPAAPPPPAQ